MRTALALLVALAAAGASAQPVVHVHDSACTLYDVGGVAVPGPTIPLPTEASRRAGTSVVTTRTTGRAATFEVSYEGFTPQAQAAFQRAVDIWADHLTSAAPIRVTARFAELDEGVLGAAGPRTLFEGTLPQFGGPTYFPGALAEALAGEDLNDGGFDIGATFNSDFDNFYFGLDGRTPAGDFDFVTIVLHELGHGLGFIGSGDVDDGDGDPECPRTTGADGVDGDGCWGFYQFTTGLRDTGIPLIFDRFLEDGSGVSLLNTDAYPNPSQTLGDLLQSGPSGNSSSPDRDLFVAAPTVFAVYGAPAPVWAPAAFDGGSSFSHWDEILITRGTSAALMTPRVSRGEAYQDPGTITCAFFSDMGWPLGDGCTFLVDEAGGGALPEITASATALAFGDVPVGQSARRVVTVTNEGAGDLRVSNLRVGGSGDFAVEGSAAAFVVAPGASRELAVVFTPTREDARAAVLRFSTNDADERDVEVRLSGTGTAATAAPVASVSPSAVTFDDTPVGESSTATVTVSNTGGADLAVSGVALSGDAAFSVPTGAFTVAPGASRGLTVTFAPTTQGGKNATLTVSTDDPRAPTVTVALNGSGIRGTPSAADPEGLGFDGPAEVAVAPNPFRSRSAVTVRVRESQDVTVAVFDVLGRRVATLWDGPAQRGEPLALALGDARLAPGAYVVRAAGAGFVVSTPVVATR